MTTISRIDPLKLSQAEKLLWHYGITQPSEIDLEAIALDLGLVVRRRKLTSADARLIAVEDRGIITVSTATHPKRQRFSIGHEIGHWVRDREREGIIACTQADVSPKNQKAKTREAEANVFSADLVLPPYLVRPIVGERPPSVDLVVELSKTFDASIPATAIRIVRHTAIPAAVVVHSKTGRDWWFENIAWPPEFRLASQVHHDSPSMDLLYLGAPDARTREQKEPGSRWLVGKDSYRLDVRVQSIKRHEDRVLTLVRLCR